MGVNFFHRKKTKLGGRGGGVRGGFGKRPHFFRIFFSATFPYTYTYTYTYTEAGYKRESGLTSLATLFCCKTANYDFVLSRMLRDGTFVAKL